MNVRRHSVYSNYSRPSRRGHQDDPLQYRSRKRRSRGMTLRLAWGEVEQRPRHVWRPESSKTASEEECAPRNRARHSPLTHILIQRRWTEALLFERGASLRTAGFIPIAMPASRHTTNCTRELWQPQSGFPTGGVRRLPALCSVSCEYKDGRDHVCGRIPSP